MRISGRPTFSAGMLTTSVPSGFPNIFPFNAARCEYFYSARYALAAAIKSLRLTSDQAVLLPSYNCGVEVDPFIRCGLHVQWYRVNTDFSVDLDDLLGRITPATSAILVTHYLGFPQHLDEISTICRDRGIVLIEDCAHAMLSECVSGPLGSFGDMSVFSFRKSLPIPDGGALLINNPAFSINKSRKIRPNLFASYFVISEMLCSGTLPRNEGGHLLENILCSLNLKLAKYMRFILRSFRKVTKFGLDSLVYPSSNHFYEQVMKWGISRLSQGIICSADYPRIREIRQRNFNYLLHNMEQDDRYQLPIRSLAEGVCPLFFPLFIENRDGIFRKLKQEGITSYDWWGDFHSDVPWNEFPDSVYMKRNLLGLPVHQDLDIVHLDKILESFRSLLDANVVKNVKH